MYLNVWLLETQTQISGYMLWGILSFVLAIVKGDYVGGHSFGKQISL